MSRKRFKPEEIVNKLREADVLLAQGQTIPRACKQIGITDQTYYPGCCTSINRLRRSDGEGPDRAAGRFSARTAPLPPCGDNQVLRGSGQHETPDDVVH